MELNKPDDVNNLTDSEKKHIPIINISGDVVTVNVGEIEHPMEEEHHIDYIELFSGDESIGKKDLKSGEKPEAVFEGVSLDNLKAQALCNLHGLWESL